MILHRLDSEVESWLDGPLTSPVCPHCGRKEHPHVIAGRESENVVYECPLCDRHWTVRLHNPQEIGVLSTRRH